MRIFLATDSLNDQAPLERLCIVARWLKEGGHGVELATANPEAAAFLAAYGISDIKLWPAPSIGRVPPVSAQASPFATHLLQSGVVSPQAVLKLIEGWGSLIAASACNFVVADGCPILSLPLSWPCRILSVGDGLDFPSPNGGDAAREVDTALLAMINQALASHETHLESFEAFCDTGPVLVFSLPEFDPRSGQRSRGNFGPLHAADIAPPEKRRTGVVAILDSSRPANADLIVALGALEQPVQILGAVTEPQRLWLQQRNKRVDFHGLPSSGHLAECAVILHGGDLRSCESAMAGGRPQIVIPGDARQLWRAHRIAERGLGIVLTDMADLRRLPAYMERLVGDWELRERAYAWGMAVREEFTTSKRRPIVEAITAFASSPTRTAQGAMS